MDIPCHHAAGWRNVGGSSQGAISASMYFFFLIGLLDGFSTMQVGIDLKMLEFLAKLVQIILAFSVLQASSILSTGDSTLCGCCKSKATVQMPNSGIS